MDNAAYVELRGITKTFGTVTANKNINLQVRRGEIHALLGENGSGKSTLVNMLSGIYMPDAGQIFIDGQLVKIRSPKDAIRYKIGMVHQHFKLVEILSARENILLGQKQGFFINEKKRSADIIKTANKYGLGIRPDKKIYDMSVGEKQTLEILKVIYHGAQVLILDEPTAVLTPQETKSLFQILRNMREQGSAIVIITHKLNEVMEISDRVTVLRKGESIGTVNTKQTTSKELIEMMVGKPISLAINRAPRSQEEQEAQPRLQVEGLTVLSEDKVKKLENVSFAVSSGEILGVAGIAGSGQKELCEVIAGLQKADGGTVRFEGHSILGLSPREIIKRGICMSFIPEDRLGMGLVGGMNIVDNVILKSYMDSKGILVDRKAGHKSAEKIIKILDVSFADFHQPIRNLSGGNIQKILLGREIILGPQLIITAYPVRGLDIGTSYKIYDVLNEEKQKGTAVLFIGEDLDVLLELCDRILVLSGGKVMDIVDARTTDKEKLGMLMLGHKEEATHV